MTLCNTTTAPLLHHHHPPKKKKKKSFLTNKKASTAATSQQGSGQLSLYGSPAFNQQKSYECWLQCYSTPQTVTYVDSPAVVRKWYNTFLPLRTIKDDSAKKGVCKMLHCILCFPLVMKMSLWGFQKSRKSLINLFSALVWKAGQRH